MSKAQKYFKLSIDNMKKMHDTKKTVSTFRFCHVPNISDVYRNNIYSGLHRYLYVTEKNTQITRIDCTNQSFKLLNDLTILISQIFLF